MPDDFIMSPKVDFAFKELMQDEQVRKGFLSAVLNIPLKEIKETILLNTFLRKRTKEDKFGILDVRVLLNNEAEINIEIQVYYFKDWEKRSLFYWADMYSGSLKEGEPYGKLKQCISISILDFELHKEEREYFSCYQLLETTRHTVYTDQMKFYVIELPKLPKELKETNDVYLWARFIASEKKEEMEMLAGKNKQISQAYHHMQVLSQDEQKKMEYKARQRAIRDTISLKEQFYEEGMEKGMEEGMEKGMDLIRSLYAILTEEGKFEVMNKCFIDKEYQDIVLQEYSERECKFFCV